MISGSLRVTALVLVCTFTAGALHAQAPSPDNAQQAVNLAWSQHIVDSTLARYPDPAKFGSWGYQRGLYLFGQYLVYRRTHDPRYLKYIEVWVDTHIDAEGHPDHKINSLDSIMASNLLVVLYQETHDQRYKLGADYFRSRFDDYPRTTDGGFWHATVPSRQWQLWLDGTYMAEPFLLRYGRAFDDSDYTDQEAVRQLLVYHKHLKSRSGLLYHAYDESGKSKWAEPVTHHSRYFWCRAIGWYGMTLVDALDVLPKNQPGRAQLIRILRSLVEALARTQDPETGLWYQVMDKPNVPGNWTETSSSSMFTYIIDVAVKRGYVSKKYHAVAEKGYRGVMSRVSLGADGLTNITGICEGTNVGDLQYYLDRKRMTNDFHGLGAFLIMNEEWNTSVASQRLNPKKEQ
jgi:unsaturated rhamnogalacturonyl hydrolase